MSSSSLRQTPASRPIAVTVGEAMRLSGLTRPRLYEAMNAGLIESRKVLGRRLIVFESLEKLLVGRADPRPPSTFAANPRAHGRIEPEAV